MKQPVRPVALASLLIVSALLLSACDRKAESGKAASPQVAEILPGSISDDMINLDTSTASPPLAPAKAASPAPAADSSKAGADEADAAAPARAAPDVPAAPADGGE